MKRPIMDGFYGYGGNSIFVDSSQEYENDDPLVLARPDLFEDTLDAVDGGTPEDSE